VEDEGRCAGHERCPGRGGVCRCERNVNRGQAARFLGCGEALDDEALASRLGCGCRCSV
jgi:hypothetical protein